MTLRVACSALGKRIYAGHPTKDGTRFREPRHDVTSDVLKAVIDKIKIGNEVEVSDGESIVARIAVLPPVTTPARAEAQDEGAAGEPVAWRIRRNKGDAGFGRPQVFTTDEATDGDLWQWRRNGYDVQPLYAHPCPTPAADADRVRSVACLTRYSPLSTGNNKAMMQEDEAGLYVLRKQALAALKAEGK